MNFKDGVASHEGRVLVMTTNHPEQLDEALIRPGRVDHQVAFSNATQGQVKELFQRMFSSDPPQQRPTRLIVSASGTSALLTPPATPTKSSSLSTTSSATSTPPEFETSSSTTNTGGLLSDNELTHLATQFSRKVPDGLLSPAEVQGFLLKRKKDPRKAVEEVDRWVDGMKEQKALKTKLVRVQ